MMFILFCDYCNDRLKVIEKERTCECGKSRAYFLKDKVYYSGDKAFISLSAPFVLPSEEDIIRITGDSDQQIFIIKIIEYLNMTAGTSFSVKYPSANSTLILARKKEGWTYSDFIKVIDKKVKEWSGTDFQLYLRPSTLFNKKNFENYVGEHAKPASRDNTFQGFADTVAAAKERVSSGGN